LCVFPPHIHEHSTVLERAARNAQEGLSFDLLPGEGPHEIKRQRVSHPWQAPAMLPQTCIAVTRVLAPVTSRVGLQPARRASTAGERPFTYSSHVKPTHRRRPPSRIPLRYRRLTLCPTAERGQSSSTGWACKKFGQVETILPTTRAGPPACVAS
jgi:hypothetical protein